MKEMKYVGNDTVVRFFHICTDGERNGIVHPCDEDFNQAIKIMAVKAWQYGVRIICYCFMSTHMHCVIRSNSYEKAGTFAEGFKRDYSKYISNKYNIRSIYQGINCKPIEITDRFYLKNCIAYVLLNPCAAHIVHRPEDFRWSSFDAYFNKSEIKGQGVGSMKDDKRRKVFRTRVDIKDSGMVIDYEGNLEKRSFVDFRFVENLFGSQTDFFKSLALTNSPVEEEKYVERTVHHTDNELFAEAMKMAGEKFGRNQLHLLTRDEKIRLIQTLNRKTKASEKRIGRILRLSPTDITHIIK